jgi:hypothetical protein
MEIISWYEIWRGTSENGDAKRRSVPIYDVQAHDTEFE